MSPSLPNISDLTGKVALITGASSGLGRATAETYAAAGAYVVSADLSPSPPEAPIFAEEKRDSGQDLTTPTVDLLNREYPGSHRLRARFVQCDVTQAASVENAVAFSVEHYGRLDIMVNNAGVSSVIHSSPFKEGSTCKLHELPDDVFKKDLAVNAHGVWLGIKHAAAQMLRQSLHPRSGDRGSIITISSIMATVALPGTSAYCGTKAVGPSLTRAAALDYAADRIHVNCILPGWADTAMLDPMKAQGSDAEAKMRWVRGLHPWGRMAKPEDVASMALFLAGPGAAFCTGGSFVVDGGYTAI